VTGLPRAAPRFAGRVALVMGGGQEPGADIGNGRAAAVLLAREGADVTVVDRDLAAAEATAGQIRDEGGKAWALAADATVAEQVADVVEEVLSRAGQLDILHNNVGAGKGLGGDAGADDITEDVFDLSFAVNVKSAWLAAKYALPALRTSAGSIVNIGSAVVLHSSPILGYKAGKHALVGLTEHLASTNARFGVRVNIVLPGAMNTAMVIEREAAAQGIGREAVIAARAARIPLAGRVGTGWDVAYAAAFLHSDEARFITGTQLVVDGGTSVAK
jgi:NAD(P)-dependent dehydrogenase (short-subunit alcohol dehydrogenase family)